MLGKDRPSPEPRSADPASHGWPTRCPSCGGYKIITETSDAIGCPARLFGGALIVVGVLLSIAAVGNPEKLGGLVVAGIALVAAGLLVHRWVWRVERTGVYRCYICGYRAKG
jgi:uncharacterized protein YjeT (DUF2065 family)